jgi:hypothetical protein
MLKETRISHVLIIHFIHSFVQPAMGPDNEPIGPNVRILILVLCDLYFQEMQTNHISSHRAACTTYTQ